MPCPFECEQCVYLEDQEKVKCLVCESNMGTIDANKAYTLNPYTSPDGADYCKCNGVIYKGECICAEPETYFDSDKECKFCSDDTHDKSGCDPNCHPHQFSISQSTCMPCHFSCDECNGPDEHDCKSCLSPYEGINSSREPIEYNGVRWCLCGCNKMQGRDGFKFIDDCSEI